MVLTAPMSRLYAWEAGRRARRFDRGIGVERIDRPVVSVGNLSAGGTGKSPVVRAVVGLLLEHGHRPAIAMRGYKARPGEPSDEQAEHAELFERAGLDVPIVAQPDRIAGLRALFATPRGRAIDCVVLDDGFQHRRLARDLDLVLIDATRPAHRDAPLPLGTLREPMSALARAHGVLLTRSSLVEPSVLRACEASVQQIVGDQVPIESLNERWERIGVFGPEGAEHSIGIEAARGARVYAACGIGNPAAFLAFARAQGLDVAGHTAFADHARYDESGASSVIRGMQDAGCETVLTTRKDWVKLRAVWPSKDAPPVWVPELGVGFGSGSAIASAVLDAVRGG